MTVASAAATALDGVAYLTLLALGSAWSALTGLALTSPSTWGRFGLPAILAALLGGVTHYTLCRRWVFKHPMGSHWRALPLYVLMSAVAALMHGALTEGLAPKAGALPAWGISKLCCYVAWTFPVSRMIVFGPPRPGA